MILLVHSSLAKHDRNVDHDNVNMASFGCFDQFWLVCICREREAVFSEVGLNYLDGNVGKPGHLVLQGQQINPVFPSLDIF